MTQAKMKLTRAERSAIFAGDYRALKRDRRPPVKGGDTLVLAWTKRSRHVADRSTGAVVEAPRKPTIWIEFREPELKAGVWVLRFSARDERQPLRLLGSTPSPRADDDEQSWTPDTERGYVASARAAIDAAEAVDDETLRGFVARSRHNRAEFQSELEKEDAELAEDARRRQERAFRDRLRETLKELGPEAQKALLARLERELQQAQADEGQRVA